MFRDRAQRLHFVGIGGIGMSGIAEVLLNLGFDVRGSDLRSSVQTKRLEQCGALIQKGHAAEHIGDADVVVISSAVNAQNPEVLEARRLGVPVIRRAEMLAELMRMKYGIAIAGMHGKTTTTSLVSEVLHHGGVDPTVVIGGRLKSISSNARLGEGEYLVAEADESDGSFLNLMPSIAVVTNIDEEHLDHWTGGLPQIVSAFKDFVNKVPFYGVSILCLDHPTVQDLLPAIEKRYVTYGFSAQATYSARSVSVDDGKMKFSVFKLGENLGEVTLNMVGRHNIQNALAAIAVADEVGVDFEVAAEALRSFSGIGRRFEIKGKMGDVLIVDDYGHHPEEIKATLRAAQESFDRRVVVAFQPHRYTRTRDLMDDFGKSFNQADVVLLTDVYAAGEDALDGANAQAMAESIQKHGHHNVEYVGDLKGLRARLEEVLGDGDLLLTLGAGDIDQVGEQILEAWSC